MAAFSFVAQPLSPVTAFCRAGGTVDSVGFEKMEEEFGKLLSSGMKGVILEAAALENMTSAALGAIINFSHLLETRGGMLVVTLFRPGNEGLLELLNVKDALRLAENVDAARKMIAGIQ